MLLSIPFRLERAIHFARNTGASRHRAEVLSPRLPVSFPPAERVACACSRGGVRIRYARPDSELRKGSGRRDLSTPDAADRMEDSESMGLKVTGAKAGSPLVGSE